MRQLSLFEEGELMLRIIVECDDKVYEVIQSYAEFDVLNYAVEGNATMEISQNYGNDFVRLPMREVN